jgi:hypothetical protein
MDVSSVEEVVLPFPVPRSRIPTVTRFRSTWLAASLHALRDLGLYERYIACVAPVHVDAITSAVAGMWLPFELAMSHYAACDRLDMSRADRVAMGVRVLDHTHRTVLAVAMRRTMYSESAKWTMLRNAQRLWDRNWIGGGVGVFKTGPREVRMELVGWPCARFDYCRVAMQGILLGFTELFCDSPRVTEIPALQTVASMGYRVSWK